MNLYLTLGKTVALVVWGKVSRERLRGEHIAFLGKGKPRRMVRHQACAATDGLCIAGNGTQGFVHAKQGLFQLSNIPSSSIAIQNLVKLTKNTDHYNR